MGISQNVKIGFKRRNSTKGHIDQRLEVVFIVHAKYTTRRDPSRLKPSITRTRWNVSREAFT